MDDTKTVPQEGQTEDKSSTPVEGGKTEGQQNAPLQSVPKNLEGKTQTDLIKMYGELERKIGEQSSEVGQARKVRQDMEVVLQAIYADPETKSGVEKNINKILGINKDDKSDGKDKPSEEREALEGQIISGFMDRTGVNNLPPEQAKQVTDRIASELRGILDPTGKKSNQEISKAISLSELPAYLNKAYSLATRDGEIDKAMQDGAAKARLQGRGAFGGIPSSGNVDESKKLSEDERYVARKLNVSEEDYLKNKKVE